MRRNVADDEGVRVQAELCATCIFRPGNLMDLNPGRLRGMVDECRRIEGLIPCHKTLDRDRQAICRGWYDRHAEENWMLRWAISHGLIVEVP